MTVTLYAGIAAIRMTAALSVPECIAVATAGLGNELIGRLTLPQRSMRF